MFILETELAEKTGCIGVSQFLEGYNLEVSLGWFCAIPEDVTRTNVLELYQDRFHFIKEALSIFRIVF